MEKEEALRRIRDVAYHSGMDRYFLVKKKDMARTTAELLKDPLNAMDKLIPNVYGGKGALEVLSDLYDSFVLNGMNKDEVPYKEFKKLYLEEFLRGWKACEKA